MFREIIFFILFFYLLILIQTGFLVSNLVLIAVILINLFFFPRASWQGQLAAFIAGFYLDIFSFSASQFFGFYTLILILSSIFIKFVFKNYVQIPTIKETPRA